MASGLPDLAGSGLAPNLYDFLWMKNNLLQTRCMYHKCPPILVPDTVQLSQRRPTGWYFSSLKTGTLQRQTKDLNMSKVVDTLLRKSDPSLDIVGTLVEKKRTSATASIDYLTAQQLERFASAGPSKKARVGVLQSFTVPKGQSNFVIRVHWTMEDVQMDSFININKLNDTSLPPNDRTSTTEEKYCVLIPLQGNVLSDQLSRMCSCIAEHINFVSQQRYQVQSMTINFRVDSNDRVWLLWCDELVVDDDLMPAVPQVQHTLLFGGTHGGMSDTEDDNMASRSGHRSRQESRSKAQSRGMGRASSTGGSSRIKPAHPSGSTSRPQAQPRKTGWDNQTAGGGYTSAGGDSDNDFVSVGSPKQDFGPSIRQSGLMVPPVPFDDYTSAGEGASTAYVSQFADRNAEYLSRPSSGRRSEIQSRESQPFSKREGSRSPASTFANDMRRGGAESAPLDRDPFPMPPRSRTTMDQYDKDSDSEIMIQPVQLDAGAAALSEYESDYAGDVQPMPDDFSPRSIQVDDQQYVMLMGNESALPQQKAKSKKVKAPERKRGARLNRTKVLGQEDMEDVATPEPKALHTGQELRKSKLAAKEKAEAENAKKADISRAEKEARRREKEKVQAEKWAKEREAAEKAKQERIQLRKEREQVRKEKIHAQEKQKEQAAKDAAKSAAEKEKEAQKQREGRIKMVRKRREMRMQEEERAEASIASSSKQKPIAKPVKAPSKPSRDGHKRQLPAEELPPLAALPASAPSGDQSSHRSRHTTQDETESDALLSARLSSRSAGMDQLPEMKVRTPSHKEIADLGRDMDKIAPTEPEDDNLQTSSSGEQHPTGEVASIPLDPIPSHEATSPANDALPAQEDRSFVDDAAVTAVPQLETRIDDVVKAEHEGGFEPSPIPKTTASQQLYEPEEPVRGSTASLMASQERDVGQNSAGQSLKIKEAAEAPVSGTQKPASSDAVVIADGIASGMGPRPGSKGEATMVADASTENAPAGVAAESAASTAGLSAPDRDFSPQRTSGQAAGVAASSEYDSSLADGNLAPASVGDTRYFADASQVVQPSNIGGRSVATDVSKASVADAESTHVGNEMFPRAFPEESLRPSIGGLPAEAVTASPPENVSIQKQGAGGAAVGAADVAQSAAVADMDAYGQAAEAVHGSDASTRPDMSLPSHSHHDAAVEDSLIADRSVSNEESGKGIAGNVSSETSVAHKAVASMSAEDFADAGNDPDVQSTSLQHDADNSTNVHLDGGAAPAVGFGKDVALAGESGKRGGVGTEAQISARRAAGADDSSAAAIHESPQQRMQGSRSKAASGTSFGGTASPSQYAAPAQGAVASKAHDLGPAGKDLQDIGPQGGALPSDVSKLPEQFDHQHGHGDSHEIDLQRAAASRPPSGSMVRATLAGEQDPLVAGALLANAPSDSGTVSAVDTVRAGAGVGVDSMEDVTSNVPDRHITDSARQRVSADVQPARGSRDETVEESVAAADEYELDRSAMPTSEKPKAIQETVPAADIQLQNSRDVRLASPPGDGTAVTKTAGGAQQGLEASMGHTGPAQAPRDTRFVDHQAQDGEDEFEDTVITASRPGQDGGARADKSETATAAAHVHAFASVHRSGGEIMGAQAPSLRVDAAPFNSKETAEPPGLYKRSSARSTAESTSRSELPNTDELEERVEKAVVIEDEYEDDGWKAADSNHMSTSASFMHAETGQISTFGGRSTNQMPAHGKHKVGFGASASNTLVTFDDARIKAEDYAPKAKERPRFQQIGDRRVMISGQAFDSLQAVSDMSGIPPRQPFRLELAERKFSGAALRDTTGAERQATQTQVSQAADPEEGSMFDGEDEVMDFLKSSAMAKTAAEARGTAMGAADKCTSERPQSASAKNFLSTKKGASGAVYGDLPVTGVHEDVAGLESRKDGAGPDLVVQSDKSKGRVVRDRESLIEDTSLPKPTAKPSAPEEGMAAPDDPTSKLPMQLAGMLGENEEADEDALTVLFKHMQEDGAQRGYKSATGSSKHARADVHGDQGTREEETAEEEADGLARDSEWQQDGWASRDMMETPRVKGEAVSRDTEPAPAQKQDDFVDNSVMFKSVVVKKTHVNPWVGETAKQYGSVSAPVKELEKARISAPIDKMDEWVYDEFTRPGDEAADAGVPGGAGQASEGGVVEVKFEAAFENDDERNMFALRQRERLAAMLGVSVDDIEVEESRAGSPSTIVRFKISKNAAKAAAARAASQPESSASSNSTAAAENKFDSNPLNVSLYADSGAGEAVRNRLQGALGAGVPVIERSAMPSAPTLSSQLPRQAGESSSHRIEVKDKEKGNNADDAASQHDANLTLDPALIGEMDGKFTGRTKQRGLVVSAETSSNDHVFRPPRLEDASQFSVINRDKKSANNRDRTNKSHLAAGGLNEAPTKVPIYEVPDTLRIKEAEHELEALPAARADEAPRAGVLIKKAEGHPGERDLEVEEFGRRYEERAKSSSEMVPSVNNEKDVEEAVYALSQKICGAEDPRTRQASEPEQLSVGDRRLKRKGKDATKIELAAVPEHYMAFGTEGESQRLPVDAATLEMPNVAAPQPVAPGASSRPPAAVSQVQSEEPKPSMVSFAEDGDQVPAFMRSPGSNKKQQQGGEAEARASAKEAVDIQVEADDPSNKPSIPSSGVEESAESSSPVHTLQKRLPRKAAAKTHLLSRIHSIESTLQRLYSKMETDADVNDGEEDNQQTGAGPSEHSRSMAEALLDEATKPTEEERRTGAGDEIATSGSLSARARLAGTASPQRSAPVQSSEERRAPMQAIRTVVGTAAMTAPGEQESRVEVGPQDSQSANQQSLDDLESSIQAERAARRARMRARLGGDAQPQHAEDERMEINEEHLTVIPGKVSPPASPEPKEPSPQPNPVAQSVISKIRASEDLSASTPSRGGVPNVASAISPSTMGSTMTHTPGFKMKARAPSLTASVGGPAASQMTDIGSPGGLGATDASIRLRADMVTPDPGTTPIVGSGLTESQLSVPPPASQVQGRSPAGSARSAAESYRDAADGGAALEGEGMLNSQQQAELLQWKSVFSKVRHNRRGEVIASLEAGCPIDLRDEAGNTLFIISAQNGNKRICKALLRRGSDINASNHRGQTALHFCFTYGFTELGNYLISKGADETAQNVYGRTPYEGLE